jgi:hypothetical protein
MVVVMMVLMEISHYAHQSLLTSIVRELLSSRPRLENFLTRDVIGDELTSVKYVRYDVFLPQLLFFCVPG